MADWLDEIEAQADETSPYYLPRLIAEIRRLRALADRGQYAEGWHRAVETICTIVGVSPALSAEESIVAVRERVTALADQGQRAADDLCPRCEGNGVIKIPGGISECPACKGRCWADPAPTGAPPDLAVAARLDPATPAPTGAPTVTRYGCTHCGRVFSHAPQLVTVPGVPARTHIFCSPACAQTWQHPLPPGDGCGGDSPGGPNHAR